VETLDYVIVIPREIDMDMDRIGGARPAGVCADRRQPLGIGHGVTRAATAR